MTKFLGLLILASLVAVFACGGDQPLTVREYAEACADLQTGFEDSDLDSMDSAAAVSTVLDYLETTLSNLRNLNPPKELERVHEAMRETYTFIQEFLNDSGIVELAEDVEEWETDAEVLSEAEALSHARDLMERMAEYAEKVEEFESELDELSENMVEAATELSPETLEALEDEGCQVF